MRKVLTQCLVLKLILVSDKISKNIKVAIIHCGNNE